METKKIREAILAGEPFKASDNKTEPSVLWLKNEYIEVIREWNVSIHTEEGYFVSVDKITPGGIHWYTFYFNKELSGFLRFSELLLLNEDGTIINPENNIPL